MRFRGKASMVRRLFAYSPMKGLYSPIAAILLVPMLGLTSCESPGEGAATGAMVGGAVGGISQGTVRGAATGAAIGAGTGACWRIGAILPGSTTSRAKFRWVFALERRDSSRVPIAPTISSTCAESRAEHACSIPPRTACSSIHEGEGSVTSAGCPEAAGFSKHRQAITDYSPRISSTRRFTASSIFSIWGHSRG